MNKFALLKALERYPVFTVKVVSEITGKNRDYAKLVVHRLRKEGIIRMVERNKYTAQSDPLIVASSLIWPCYISGWSALRFHNLTEQLPPLIQVITTKRRKKRELSLDSTRIVFTRTKPECLFGYRRENYRGFLIFIAEKEKALLDSALFRMLSFTEICSIIREHKEGIDLELLVSYLLRTGNRTLMKRFGYMLESLGKETYPSLKKNIDRRYVPLDYACAPEGKKDRRWMVMDNVGD